MSGVASEAGTLTIRGVHAQLSGGISTEFLLPIQSAEEETKAEKRRSALNLEIGRVKYSGLEARELVRRRRVAEKRLSSQPQKLQPTIEESKFLTCKIVEEQPLLRVRKSNLTHGALMLFEGET
jgi:trafficking protein particle complex subunit 9